MSKLIVIRGPSGAGKSSVATELQKRCPSKNLLISEDQLRFMFSNWKEAAHTASKKLAMTAVLSGLESGFDVIYEGILNIKTYREYFDKILLKHPHDNYFFYLDVSFDETLKRHQTRPQKDEFGQKEMKVWLEYATPTGFKHETIIAESTTLLQSVELILKAAKYV